jgi:hypothetical protein
MAIRNLSVLSFVKRDISCGLSVRLMLSSDQLLASVLVVDDPAGFGRALRALYLLEDDGSAVTRLLILMYRLLVFRSVHRYRSFLFVLFGFDLGQRSAQGAAVCVSLRFE